MQTDKVSIAMQMAEREADHASLHPDPGRACQRCRSTQWPELGQQQNDAALMIGAYHALAAMLHLSGLH